MAEIVCCALPNVAKCRRPHWRNVAVVYHRQNWLEVVLEYCGVSQSLT